MLDKNIYFMRPRGRRGPIKIGCSRYTGQRLRNMSLWSPFPLEIVAETPGSHTYERYLHSMFEASRTHLEWFKPTKALEAIIDRVRAGEPLPSIIGEIPHGWCARRWKTADAGRRSRIRLRGVISPTPEQRAAQ